METEYHIVYFLITDMIRFPDSQIRQMVILIANYYGVSLWSIILHQLPIFKPCCQLSVLQSELKLNANQMSIRGYPGSEKQLLYPTAQYRLL
jgi:hypothetical protein